MKSVLFAAALSIALAMLILGSRPVVAQAPTQAGGFVQGQVYGFDMYDRLMPLEWVRVTAANAQYRFDTSTGANGTYGMFLPGGAFNLSVDAPGYKPYSQSIFVGEGSSSVINMYLYQSGVPVPELPTQALSLAVVFVIAAGLLTKVRKHKR
jgi:hypothetical protein